MNSPKRYLSPGEGNGDGTNDQQNRLASALNDETIIPAQEQKERFASAPKILHDTFILQDDGSFLVQMPEKSGVMDGHIKDMPIVPGIVLKRLFFHQTDTEAQGIVATQFLGGVFSGQTIIVRRDGIYTPAGKKLMAIAIDTQDQIQSPDTDRTIRYQRSNQPFDDYLLQQHAFRFIDSGEKEGVMKPGTHFRGEFRIPENFAWAEDGKISPELLEEIGAQIGVYATGPDLNKDIPLIQTVEGKTQLHPESKIFTFKSGKSLATDLRAQVGETIYIQGRIIIFDPNGKEAYFCYTAENKDNQKLLSGEIKAHIVSLKILIRKYGQIKNAAQR